ncbi:M14 metallopeptidase family protein [Rhodonellum sp.]|uniref:M14 family metallopeptidase n=1 Tax=Rhodonellum sp. TaxID=2231180 RepID=UPI00272301B3|nr:M14 metallopeptidase family protein [Rhodonellum sp.]MDO9554319.1 M14 family metallopeptidase [Rhodonellum sp.]
MIRKIYCLLGLAYWMVLTNAIAQQIPSPKEHFGFEIGEDYKLATFTATDAYFRKVAALSDRVKFVEIGPTEEGRQMPMMIITSPENHQKLARYKEISQLLGRAEIGEEEARKLSLEGKAVVWIDGGLHSTETVGSHQLIDTYYQLVTRTDAENMRMLDDLIILMVQVNPDGQEIVTNWYMGNEDVKKRDMNSPYMYQKYVGHDNNRDFFMMNMKETTNTSLQQYVEWLPQIIYNHHQTSPAGTVVAGPPYRDPFNHVFDPLIMTSLDGVGSAMINRLNVEDRPGYTRLSGSVFSSWWNGGLRTTPYFHNMIGVLTEITGGPTPSEIPLIPERLIPTHATPFPVEPQAWNFKKSLDYSVSLNYAILDYASRNSDALLYNIYKMGRNSIERGSMDHWTKYPKRSAAIQSVFDAAKEKAATDDPEMAFFGMRSGLPGQYFDSVFKDPNLRDPRGFILSSDQSDFSTVVRFMNALIKSGILVHKATSAFTVKGKQYPAGSYVVKSDQAFRPHVLDMFEPQDHPNDFQFPGGPPVRPYDAAGWTLAFQMGVEFDRIMDGFDGPFERITLGEVQPFPVYKVPSGSGFLLDSRANNSFMAVNDLLKAGVAVSRTTTTVSGLPAGSFYVSGGKSVLEKAAKEYGVKMVASSKPAGVVKINPARIALFDHYGGSMPSGWVRWMMEQYHFAFQVVYPEEIDKGNLKAKYDVILFIGPGAPGTVRNWNRMPKTDEIDAQYHNLLGALTKDKSIPELKKFMEAGGNVVAVGASTSLAYDLGLPISNALVEKLPNGKERALPGDKYYVPGSILKAKLDGNHSSNWGMGESANMVFNNSPVFSLAPDALIKGVKPLAWLGTESSLISGWAWGESYLKNGVLAFEAPIGKGKLIAYGPEITFRAQAHNTFKLLFNQLYTQ